ncbi:Ribosome biogenesis protein BRX1 [Coelomomyces lativittatus]|nr:Ribosome biogenesis protein BRX1 [Coelomomyces lativittatus]KAJ1501619.1 Ribosome biogenesis protein BRX1 [Coelomomyces lativittatus]
MYFESKQHQDQFLWIANAPNGPSIKFEVVNVHTMAELNFIGNHLKYSRTLLSFDATFDDQPHLQLIKHLLIQVLNVPLYTRSSKPFFDHILTFTYLDQGIWVRNYQVPNVHATSLTSSSNKSTSEAKKLKKQPSSMTSTPLEMVDKDEMEELEKNWLEVGPRCVWKPIAIYQGSFQGICLWKQPHYQSPTLLRRLEKQDALLQRQQKGTHLISSLQRHQDILKKKMDLEDPIHAVFKESHQQPENTKKRKRGGEEIEE